MNKLSDFDEQKKEITIAADIVFKKNLKHPPNFNVLLRRDLVVIRLNGFLSQAGIKCEKERLKNRMIYKKYTKLFEPIEKLLADRIEKATMNEVKASQNNINLEGDFCVMHFILSGKSN